MLKKIAVISGIVTISCLGFFIGLYILAGYNNQFYDVESTCSIIDISDTDFCTQQRRMNYEVLEESLTTRFPTQETTYSDIISSIDETIYFGGGDCTEMTANRRNLCPEPNRCTSSYSCYVDSPVQRIHFGFDSNGQLGGFTVPADNS